MFVARCCLLHVGVCCLLCLVSIVVGTVAAGVVCGSLFVVCCCVLFVVDCRLLLIDVWCFIVAVVC